MAPNLYIILRTLASPSDWVSKRHGRSHEDLVAVNGQPLARSEHWKSPVPGVYRYCLGSGWYLIQLDSNPSKPEQPDHVIYCEPLHRSILESDYKKRTIKAKLPKGCSPPASRSTSPTRVQARSISPASRRSSRQEEQDMLRNFVRHDDGVTWVNDRDAYDNPTKGPWQRFYLDAASGEMRVMTKGDFLSHSRNGSVVSNAPSTTYDLDTKSMVTSIQAIAPELDGYRSQAPSFLGPRSLAGSSRSSRRNSLETSRPTSIRMPSDTSTKTRMQDISNVL